MAQITFSPGDTFQFGRNAYGLVLSEGEALMITGEGGRTGHKQEKGAVPNHALPCAKQDVKFEITFAFEAVALALNLELSWFQGAPGEAFR
jgi:hypothetical protein